jgi:predicted kinase
MIISPDHHLITPDGVYHWTPARVKVAWHAAKEQFKAALGGPVKPDKVVLLIGVPASGKSTWVAQHEDEGVLYFDACFDLPWKRKPYIDLAHSIGVPVEAVWFDTPLAVCVQRNAERSEDRRVPGDILRAMHTKILSSPPTEREGITLTRVTP